MDKKIFAGLVIVLLVLLGFFGYKKMSGGKNSIGQNSTNNQQAAMGGTGGETVTPTGTLETNQPISQGMTLTVSQPADNSTVAQSALTITGTTTPEADVFINDKQLKADAAGNFSGQVSLDEGQNIIVVSANDNLGNYAEKDLTITLESTQ